MSLKEKSGELNYLVSTVGIVHFNYPIMVTTVSVQIYCRNLPGCS